MKQCGKCKGTFPLTDFFANKNTKTGLYNACKTCHMERTKKYRQTYLDKNHSVQRDYYVRTIPQKMLATVRTKAKAKGIPCDIDITDIVIPAVCPVFGTPFEVGVGRPLPTSASIDKIIPSLGYVKGNIQIISALANTMKNSASPEQLKQFATWVLNK